MLVLHTTATDPTPQPLMSLLFGRLTQDFVSFETTLNFAHPPGMPPNQTAIDQIPISAAAFKRSAALNASYLVYIGMFSPAVPWPRALTISSARCGHVRRDIRLYVHMGLHRRGERQAVA